MQDLRVGSTMTNRTAEDFYELIGDDDGIFGQHVVNGYVKTTGPTNTYYYKTKLLT